MLLSNPVPPDQMQDLVTQNLFIPAIIIAVGSVAGWLSKLVKLPDTVLFIFAGVLFGPAGLGLVAFQADSMASLLIFAFGAAFILYDGGREVEFQVLNRIKISLVSLATLGVVISSAMTMIPIHYILNIDWPLAFLMAVIISPTDPSVLVPLFKKISLPSRLKQIIIAESAMNDAASAVVAMAAKSVVLAGAGMGAISLDLIQESLLDLGLETSVGLLTGLGIGLLYVVAISRGPLGLLKQYTTQTSFAAVLIAYSVSTMLGGSGFMSVFVVGLLCGNMSSIRLKRLPHHLESQTRFKEELTLIMRMMIFVLLGTNINFAILAQYWWQIALVVAFHIFISRPVSVIGSVTWDFTCRWKRNELFFMMWTRETGVIAAALAGSVAASGVPHGDLLSGIVFATILTTLILQASTASPLASYLNLQTKPIKQTSNRGPRRNTNRRNPQRRRSSAGQGAARQGRSEPVQNQAQGQAQMAAQGQAQSQARKRPQGQA